MGSGGSALTTQSRAKPMPSPAAAGRAIVTAIVAAPSAAVPMRLFPTVTASAQLVLEELAILEVPLANSARIPVRIASTLCAINSRKSRLLFSSP